MASLGGLLRGEKSAVEEAAELGLIVRRDGDTVEVSDLDSRTLLGLVPSRAGALVYHVDSAEHSFEAVILEDVMLLDKLELSEIVERDEDGVRVKPPSIWLHEIDPGLENSRGRICSVARGAARCKPI
ncbi:hypothetical protein Pyrfu_1391 [Pyrolobus fumarii 1A]|uniref:Uncharacterized protein n=1 Tax=Pyrolobus fumarii (strain DSM 11204 / 1A) TaxID=694429 RepID=G0EGV1_PYRF1|nr:hypothetical protein [Pyrolobus fumarii]AEM39249.1 hypothetical protein Pyrfu_1391 [Pyrolobus fumarii 1A]